MLSLQLKSSSIQERTLWARIAQRLDRIIPSLRLVALCSDGTKLVYRQNDATSSFGARELYDETVLSAISRLNEGDIFIDIGSNSGVWSMRAAKQIGSSGTVICFEPQSTPFSDLILNGRLNNIHNVRGFNCAVSDKFEAIAIAVPEGHSGRGRVARAAVEKSGPILSRSVAVDGGTVEAILKGLMNSRRKIGIKIDVEGFEKTVLEALRPILKYKQLDFVVVEICRSHLEDYGTSPAQIYDFMHGLGFASQISVEQSAKLQYDEVFIK